MKEVSRKIYRKTGCIVILILQIQRYEQTDNLSLCNYTTKYSVTARVPFCSTVAGSDELPFAYVQLRHSKWSLKTWSRLTSPHLTSVDTDAGDACNAYVWAVGLSGIVSTYNLIIALRQTSKGAGALLGENQILAEVTTLVPPLGLPITYLVGWIIHYSLYSMI